NQPAILAVLLLPVVDASNVEPLDPFVAPDFLAGRRIERDERVVLSPAVDEAPNDDRVEVGLARRIGPGDLKLLHVRCGDAGRGDEPGAVRAAGIVAPFARVLAVDREPDDTGERDGRRRRDKSGGSAY